MIKEALLIDGGHNFIRQVATHKGGESKEWTYEFGMNVWGFKKDIKKLMKEFWPKDAD